MQLFKIERATTKSNESRPDSQEDCKVNTNKEESPERKVKSDFKFDLWVVVDLSIYFKWKDSTVNQDSTVKIKQITKSNTNRRISMNTDADDVNDYIKQIEQLKEQVDRHEKTFFCNIFLKINLQN